MKKIAVAIILLLSLKSVVCATHLATLNASNINSGTLNSARLDPSSVTLQGNSTLFSTITAAIISLELYRSTATQGFNLYIATAESILDGVTASTKTFGLYRSTAESGLRNVSLSTGELRSNLNTIVSSNVVAGTFISSGAGTVNGYQLASTTVTAGQYTSANISIDADGRIVEAANGSAGGGGGDGLGSHIATTTLQMSSNPITYTSSIIISSAGIVGQKIWEGLNILNSDRNDAAVSSATLCLGVHNSVTANSKVCVTAVENGVDNLPVMLLRVARLNAETISPPAVMAIVGGGVTISTNFGTVNYTPTSGYQLDVAGSAQAINMNLTGNLSKASGTFKIPYPGKSDKWLYHGFVESDEYGLLYHGKGQLENGTLTVTLPEYFEVVNSTVNRTVQLTCANGYSPLYLDGEIINGQFTIKTTPEGKLDQEFMWTVHGQRGDPYIRALGTDKVDENGILLPVQDMVKEAITSIQEKVKDISYTPTKTEAETKLSEIRKQYKGYSNEVISLPDDTPNVIVTP